MPALVVSLIIFTVLGIRYSGIAMNQEGIDVIRNGLAANYHFSPVLWIPFIVLVVSIVLKVPALASLMFGCIAGLIVALIFQGDGVSAVLGFMWNGYSASTGLESIDKILNRGGMTNMMYIIGIVLTCLLYTSAEHVRHARPARVNRRTGAAAVAHGEHRRRIAAHYSLNQQRTYAARPGMISLMYFSVVLMHK